MRWPRIALALFGLLAGCSEAPAPAEREVPEPTRSAGEIDLGAVVDRARSRFRAVDGVHLARSSMLEARAARDGSLHLRARDADLEGAITLRTADLGAGEAEVSEDGSLERRGARVTEVLVLREGAVEQSWRLPERPEGDLTVRVEIAGASYVGRTGAGLHFRGEGEIGFRYGHGTLVGAHGERTSVPAVWSDGAIELRVPEAVLERASFPAVLDPTITPEIDLDAPLRVPHSSARSPLALFDGTNYWVAWDDYGRIYGSARLARVAPDGTVLDPDGIVIEGIRSPADIVLAGDRLFVVGDDGEYVPTLRAVRVALDGTVLDPVPIDIRRGSVSRARVASDGTDALVTFAQSSGTPGAVRVSRAGVVLDTTPIALPAPIDDVEHSSGRYVLAAARSTDIALWRMANDGTLLDTTPVAVPTPTRTFDVVLGRTPAGLLLAWFETTLVMSSYRNTGVAACELDEDGALGVSPVVSIASTGEQLMRLRVASGASQSWLAWYEFRGTTLSWEVLGARVSSAGAMLDSTPVELATGPENQQTPAIATSPTSTLVAWSHDSPSPRWLVGRRIADDASWIDPASFPIATAANGEVRPAAAFGAGVHLVAWTDLRSLATSYGDVYGVRVANDGTVLDTSAIPIATESSQEDVTDVVFDGTSFLVLYTVLDAVDGYDIHARRVAPDGSLPDAAPFPLVVGPGAQVAARGASDGSQHLVAWTDAGTVAAARFALDGTPIGTPITLYAPNRAFGVEVAYAAGTFFVAWDHRILYTTRTANWGVRIAPDGTLLDATAVTLPVGDEGILLAEGPDGVLTLGFRLLSSQLDWYSAWWGPTGSPGPVGWTRTVTDGGGHWLGAAWTGGRYYAFGYEYDPLGSRRHFGVALDSRGGLDPQGIFDVMLLDEYGGYGTATSGADGRALFAYSRTVVAPPYGAQRVRVRFVGDPPAANGTTCMRSADCASGFCADGVCCDSACGGSDPSDCQACSASAGALVDGECAPLSVGTTCRAAGGVCDVAEACDGTSITCPSDALVASGAACRPARGECDLEEVCDGAGVACPSDARRTSAHVCRASAGVCDTEERCDGALDTCPADRVVRSGIACRAAAGVCDVGEVCDGSSVACPADVRRASDFVCRASVGACDVEDRCDGTTVACPADARRGSDVVCRASAGECDVEDRCDGVSAACPPDAVRGSAFVCRASAGECDVEDRCDGVRVTCTADAVRGRDHVCRASAGECDVEDRCDGATVACPRDAFEPAGVACREASGACDAAESCTGASGACPPDEAAPDGTACGDDLLCNGAQACAAGECVAGPEPDCDDGDPCTTDACWEPAVCAHVEIPECREPPPTGCGCRAAGGRGPPLGLLGVLVLAASLRRTRRDPPRARARSAR